MLITSYLHNDIGSHVEAAGPASQPQPVMGKPVGHEEPHTQRKDSQWVQQDTPPYTQSVSHLMLRRKGGLKKLGREWNGDMALQDRDQPLCLEMKQTIHYQLHHPQLWRITSITTP